MKSVKRAPSPRAIAHERPAALLGREAEITAFAGNAISVRSQRATSVIHPEATYLEPGKY